MSIRANIAILLFLMVQAMLFFAGVIITLMVADLTRDRVIGFAITIVVSVPISLMASWWLAPRLRARYLREHVPAIREEL
jgi:hypothetical protein